MDSLSPAERSESMARLRSNNMWPDLTVRRLVHGMGLHYRLQGKDLPGPALINVHRFDRNRMLVVLNTLVSTGDRR